MSEAERLTLGETLREQALELKAWWAREMLDSPAPLVEVMTLFWHGHFTPSLSKVKAPALRCRGAGLAGPAAGSCWPDAKPLALPDPFC